VHHVQVVAVQLLDRVRAGDRPHDLVLTDREGIALLHEIVDGTEPEASLVDGDGIRIAEPRARVVVLDAVEEHALSLGVRMTEDHGVEAADAARFGAEPEDLALARDVAVEPRLLLPE